MFVTGAGRGVGRAIALRFARDGYRVAATGRTETSLRVLCDEIAAAGGAALAIGCDVTDRAQVTAAVERTGHALGEIDVLVNNAGAADSAPFAVMDDDMWDRMLGVNLTGTYNCMRAIMPGMFDRGRGRVINIASIGAKKGFAYTAAYVAAKHGVLGLTRAVAIEAGPRGVTVNAICPGWVESDMTGESIARIVSRTGQSEDAARRALERMNPRQRFVQPDEIAGVAAFLASPAAQGINGKDIEID